MPRERVSSIAPPLPDPPSTPALPRPRWGIDRVDEDADTDLVVPADCGALAPADDYPTRREGLRMVSDHVYPVPDDATEAMWLGEGSPPILVRELQRAPPSARPATARAEPAQPAPLFPTSRPSHRMTEVVESAGFHRRRRPSPWLGVLLGALAGAIVCLTTWHTLFAPR